MSPPHSNKIFRPNRIITWELGTRKGLSFLFLSFDFYSIVPKVGIAFYSIRRAEQVKSRMCHRFFFWTSAKMVSHTIIMKNSHLLMVMFLLLLTLRAFTPSYFSHPTDDAYSSCLYLQSNPTLYKPIFMWAMPWKLNCAWAFKS